MAISVVQDKGNGSTLGTTVVVTLNGSPSNGNNEYAVIEYGSSTASVSSVTQTGATWALDRRYADVTELRSVEIWHAVSVSGAATAITATLSSTGIAREMHVIEVSGMGGSSTLDKSNDAGGLSATADTGSTATTTQANEIWISGFGNIETGVGTGVFSAPTNGYTLLQTQNPVNNVSNVALCYKIVSATGTAGNALTIDDTAKWVATATSFYGTSAAVAVPLVPVLGA